MPLAQRALLAGRASDFLNALKRVEDLPTALYFLGGLIAAWAGGLMRRGKFRESVYLFDLALACPALSQLSFYCNALWPLLASNSEKVADPSEAARFIERCLPYAPQNPAIYQNAALLVLEQGDTDAAVRYFGLACRHYYAKLGAMKKELIQSAEDKNLPARLFCLRLRKS